MYCKANPRRTTPKVLLARGWSLCLQGCWFKGLILQAHAATVAKDRKSSWLQDLQVSCCKAFCSGEGGQPRLTMSQHKSWWLQPKTHRTQHNFFIHFSPMRSFPRPTSISWVKLKPIEIVASDRNSIMLRVPVHLPGQSFHIIQCQVSHCYIHVVLTILNYTSLDIGMLLYTLLWLHIKSK